MIRNINERFGDPVEFDSVDEMKQILENMGDGSEGNPVNWNPEDGLVEGRDYEVIE